MTPTIGRAGYAIVEAAPESKIGFEAYGAAREAWRYQGGEFILEGPYETGKTISCLHKLNALLAKYPGTRALMVRRSYASLCSSAAVTFERKVLPYPPEHPKCAIRKVGGIKPAQYLYPNGSSILLGGLDNADKFLSAEFDYIYINQAEELKLDDYEKLAGRATGRAGNAPYPQVIADCNPDVPTHWILGRDRLKRFKSRHEDNPTLFNQLTGQITAQGERTMAMLNALTGVRLKRGRFGLWVGAEGMVYETWDKDTHLITVEKAQRLGFLVRGTTATINVGTVRNVFASVDWGYTNPGVIQVWAVDGDGRMCLVHEVYQTGHTIDWWKAKAKELHKRYQFSVMVCDPSEPAYIAQFRQAGLPATEAKNEIRLGLEKAQDRFAVAGDGKPRFFLLETALEKVDPALEEAYRPKCTAEEIPAYVYAKAADGKPNKEEPVPVDDHGCDALRYAVLYVDTMQRSKKRARSKEY